MEKFEELQFFTGESIHADGMIMILHYKEVDGEETPCLISFKHGLLEKNANRVTRCWYYQEQETHYACIK